MKLYDITQELFSCKVYEGDPAPQVQPLLRMSEGGQYNLSAFSLCAHNGTHVDAPAHFIKDGKTIEQIPLEVFVGDCSLVRCEGEISAETAEKLLKKAHAFGAAERLLIGGAAVVTEEAAAVFAKFQLKLLGNESQSVGPLDAPMKVHQILLGKEMVLLEGIVLTDIPEGPYFLNAAPLNTGGLEGSPCRAWLMEV